MRKLSNQNLYSKARRKAIDLAGLSICLRVRNSNEMLDRNERFLPPDGRSGTGMKITLTEMSIEASSEELKESRTLSDNFTYAMSRFLNRLCVSGDDSEDAEGAEQDG